MQNAHCVIDCNAKLIQDFFCQLLCFFAIGSCIVIAIGNAIPCRIRRSKFIVQFSQAIEYCTIFNRIFSFEILCNQFPYRCDNDQLFVRGAFVQHHVNDVNKIVGCQQDTSIRRIE